MTTTRDQRFKAMLSAGKIMEKLVKCKQLDNATRREIFACVMHYPSSKKLHEIRAHTPLLQQEQP